MSSMNQVSTAFITPTIHQTKIQVKSKQQRTVKHLPQKMSLIDTLEKLMITTIFPEDDEIIKTEDPNKELAFISDLAVGTSAEIAFAQKSLASFLLQWGKALARAEGSEKLATPIYCIPFSPKSVTSMTTSSTTSKQDMPSIRTTTEEKSILVENVVKTSGVKISFLRQKRYLSMNEQREMEKGRLPDRKGAKIDSKSPGGVLFLIQITSCCDTSTPTRTDMIAEDNPSIIHDGEQHQLQLIAKRCDIDDDTIVKVASERTIIRRLNDAIRVWKKMRSL